MQSNPHGQRFNALKHGLYAESAVLPGEDMEAFRRTRQLAFLEHRPQTVGEAKLVERLVECQWQFDRYRPLQRDADHQALCPERDGAGQLAEPVTHQRTHTSMDVTVQRDRVDRTESRVLHRLLLAQKMRRLGLVEGAVKLPPGCYMDVTGEVVQVIDARRLPTRVCQVADVVPQPLPPTGPSASSNKADGFRAEQKEMGTARPAPRPGTTFPADAQRSHWPLHVDSAANVDGIRATASAPTSCGWPEVA